MTSAQSVKIAQALDLISSLEKLKQEQRFCNFTVKVDDESFEVDKNVLAASSPYFDALFSSNMEEVQAGVVDMKKVDADAISLCIGFMYSGEANLQMENIHHTLHAANLLQLQRLMILCFDYMEDHLSPQNCIQVMLLSDIYSNESSRKKAYEVLTSKLEDVGSSKTLCNLNSSVLSQCLNDFAADHQTIWNVALLWVKKKNKEIGNSLLDIFLDCGFEKFPLTFLLETVLEEPHVKNDVNLVKLVTDAIFSEFMKLEKEIGDDIEKCFKLEKTLGMLENDGGVKESILIDYFIRNAAKVFKTTGFHDLSDHIFAKIFQEGNCSEELKYQALLGWTKHDLESRTEHFLNLFNSIELITFSLDFLKENVQSEIMVKESPECYEALMNALFVIAEKSRSEIFSLKTKVNSSAMRECFKCEDIRDGTKFYFYCCGVYAHNNCISSYPPISGYRLEAYCSKCGSSREIRL